MATPEFLRRAYWSPLGAPLRAIRGAKRPPAGDPYWDSQVSGRFAPRLGGTLSIDTRNQIVAMLLKHHAPNATSILDMGCAGGTLAPVVLGSGFARYVGVDISPVAVEIAKARVPGGEFFVSDLHSFNSSERFDVIAFNEVLYYLDLDSVVSDVSRCREWLSDEGLVCVSLNQHPKGRAIQRRLMRDWDFAAGFIYQEKLALDARLRVNRDRPPYFTFVLRPCLGRSAHCRR